MPSTESRRIAAALAQRVGPDADAATMADVVIAIWRDIERRLSPIVGTHGVAALHARSLFMAGKSYPWLCEQGDDSQQSLNLVALRSTLVARDAHEVHAACLALFVSFHELLASMVGPALTERLLLPVWDTPSSGQPAQDTTA